MEFGKIEYICDGRPKRGEDKKSLQLTLIGLDDSSVLTRKGVRALRLARILRLTKEAAEQGCLLGYEDLSALLLASLATLKRDVSSLYAEGHEVPVKGRRNRRAGDIGEHESPSVRPVGGYELLETAGAAK